MKILVGWLFLVAIAFVACSIKHQSEQYECESTADCAPLGDNRVCSDGLCVVPGGNPNKDAAIDARPPDSRIDALVCPSSCTSCNTEKRECVVDCSQNNALCQGALSCPAGWSCIFKCNTASSCRQGVSCQAALGCRVECTGNFACRNVQCGAGPCDVTCSGSSSCSGISCNASCACDVECGQAASCFNVVCTKPQCDTGLGCSSQPVGCETCP